MSIKGFFLTTGVRAALARPPSWLMLYMGCVLLIQALDSLFLVFPGYPWWVKLLANLWHGVVLACALSNFKSWWKS